ncbi:hypothetical protein HWQ46_18075 [Shewanella sp. D64]|uniref:hypothetical protein n=1 Tax=Shewanella sp. D64 TaxID=392163 RepID=UPI002DD667A6|nr:hypothetical protein [Shewanella sp. D64]MEC4727455.1 hypothetical protein [Shewanella sp. D64]
MTHQFINTNRYKDVIAQREFSASEARSLITPALITFTTSMWFATSEEHSCSTFKLVNAVSDALKLACKECFWLPTSALNELTRE